MAFITLCVCLTAIDLLRAFYKSTPPPSLYLPPPSVIHSLTSKAATATHRSDGTLANPLAVSGNVALQTMRGAPPLNVTNVGARLAELSPPSLAPPPPAFTQAGAPHPTSAPPPSAPIDSAGVPHSLQCVGVPLLPPQSHLANCLPPTPAAENLTLLYHTMSRCRCHRPHGIRARHLILTRRKCFCQYTKPCAQVSSMSMSRC